MKGIIIPDQNQSECVNNIWDKVSNFSDDSRTINYFWINTKNSRFIFIFDIFWRTIYFAQIAAKHFDDCVDSCSFHRIKYHRVKPDPTRKSDSKAGKVISHPFPHYFFASKTWNISKNVCLKIQTRKHPTLLLGAVARLVMFVSAVFTRYLKTTCPSFFNVVTQLKTQFSNINVFYKSGRNNEHVSFPFPDSFRE